MEFCSQCGNPLPDGQDICSMCMGDVDFGDDHYYEQWLQEQEQKAYENQIEKEYYEELNNFEEFNGYEELDQENLNL